jgi:hypothetical protein
LRTVMAGDVRHGRILMDRAPCRNPSRCGFHTVCKTFAVESGGTFLGAQRVGVGAKD